MAVPQTGTVVVPRAAVLSARGLTERYRMGEVDAHALRGVDLDLDDPPAALGDGYRVEAAIRVARVASALAVPAGAVFRDVVLHPGDGLRRGARVVAR